MNFSFCLAGVFFLAVDICLASVTVKFNEDNEIIKVYAERKKENRHLAQIATLSEDERIAACTHHRPGKYVKFEESNPHIYKVLIPDGVIPEDEEAAGSSKPDKPGSPKAESPKQEDRGKAPMGAAEEEEIMLEKGAKELKLKEVEQKKPEAKEESEKEPKMIYDEDIGFRCHTEDPHDTDFILSYGFAQQMFFVSEPVGEIDANKPLSGRQMKLAKYMFAPPVLENLNHQQVHQKYLELRQRTEKVRADSNTLMEDIESHDDISALDFQEKNILCACIMETDHYKKQGLTFVPTNEPDDYKYAKFEVGFSYEKMDDKFDTEFMKCKVKNGESTPGHVGVTRSYNEGGDVFTAVLDEKAKTQTIDVEVVQIPVLFNRKYSGQHEGVLEVLEAIRGGPSGKKEE